jgi:hypothetical protein
MDRDLCHLGSKSVLIEVGFAETLEGKVTTIGNIALWGGGITEIEGTTMAIL